MFSSPEPDRSECRLSWWSDDQELDWGLLLDRLNNLTRPLTAGEVLQISELVWRAGEGEAASVTSALLSHSVGWLEMTPERRSSLLSDLLRSLLSSLTSQLAPAVITTPHILLEKQVVPPNTTTLRQCQDIPRPAKPEKN